MDDGVETMDRGKAFDQIGRSVFVEHTGLHLPDLHGLPGGLIQIFWDNLQADSFASLVTNLGNNTVTAKTVIGYCDCRDIHYFEGEHLSANFRCCS